MSSKRKLRRQSCEGKQRYDTHALADKAARFMSWKLHQNIGAYHCKFCNGYHIGHTPKWVRNYMMNEN